MNTTTHSSDEGRPRRRTVLRAMAGGAVIGATLRGATASAAQRPFADGEAGNAVLNDRPARTTWHVSQGFAQVPLPAPAAFRGHAAFPSLVSGPRGSVTLAYRNAVDHVDGLDGALVLGNGVDHSGGGAPMQYGNFRTVHQNPTAWGTAAGDYRDPSVSRIGNDLWLSWCVGPTQIGALGAFVQQGDRAPVRIDPGLAWASMCAPVVELPNGRVAAVFYGRQYGETRVSTWFATADPGSDLWWSERIIDGPTFGQDFPEPYLLVRPSGQLVVMHRYGTWSHIGITTSDDNGDSWSTPRIAVPTATGRPTTFGTSTGQLLMIYRHPTSRSALLTVSDDDGQTWSAPVVLFASEGGPLGMTYAAMAEVRPRVVHVVIASERPGGVSVLHAGELTARTR